MKLELDLTLTPEQIAEAFCALDDQGQADFFIAVAAFAKKNWEDSPMTQWMAVGNHLRSCECSNDDARDVIESIHYGLTNPLSDHG